MLIPKSAGIGVMTVQGGIALVLGLSFVYLSATMTNPLFEALAVVAAIMLGAAALVLAAITDWFAAFSRGMKSAHRIAFYLLAGVGFALAGMAIAYYPGVYLQWTVGLAALHALIFGISAFAFVFAAQRNSLMRATMAAFGTVSVLFSGAAAASIAYLDDRASISVLGAYLIFIGIKLLSFAWISVRPAKGDDSNVLRRAAAY
jgi:hypothetical protein